MPLTPAERAVLLLRDVFDFDYRDIAELVGKSEPAFHRPRWPVILTRLSRCWPEDAVLITDGGPQGRRAAGIRNLQAPLSGARRIAAFISATSRSIGLVTETHTLNGQPALVFYHEDEPFAALLPALAEDRFGCQARL